MADYSIAEDLDRYKEFVRDFRERTLDPLSQETLTLHKFLSSGAFRAAFIVPHGDFSEPSIVTLCEV